MAGKYIFVTYTEGSTSLDIDPPDLTIQEMDWVWWCFSGIPSDAYGIITFDAGMGPFQTTRSYRDQELNPDSNHQWVLAKGNTGIQGSYHYKAMVIVPGAAAPEASGDAWLRNESARENRSPKVRVIYRPPVSPDPLGTLEVTPLPLQLFDGDTAIWESENLPLGSFLDFKFKDIDSPPSGPFVAVYTVLDSGDERKIHGTGFAVHQASEIQQFEYLLELRNDKGELIARSDPQIDRLPPPPPPDGNAS